MHMFKTSKIETITKTEHKSIKKCIYRWTLILKAFWNNFGSVLGGQNLRFWHFFVICSKQNLQHNMEGLKIRTKMTQKRYLFNFGVGAAVCAAPGERKKDRGNAKLHTKLHESLAWNLGNAFKECIFETLDLLFGTLGLPFGRRRIC